MKCIRHNGKSIRVANETALERVESGSAHYISKQQWRSDGGTYDGPMVSAGKRSIHPPKGWVNRSNQKPSWAK